jgi:tetratricopeptide (TPR) repeat protein
MNTLCEKLDLFIDGELSEEECQHMHGHLAGCEVCATGFHEALQLEVLAAEAFGARNAQRPPAARKLSLVPRLATSDTPPEARRRVGKPRRALWGMGVAAALAAVVYVSLPVAAPSPELWLAQAPTRRLEARLGLRPLETYRPFVPMRSGGSSGAEPVPLPELARLDEHRDAVAIAAAFLVRGDAEQARGYLEAAPASAERDNALAVVAMQRGELSEALRLLEGVLRAEPGHVPAQWNRALVLRDMGQKQQAAQAFEQLAARGEPGWSREAARDAQALHEQAP